MMNHLLGLCSRQSFFFTASIWCQIVLLLINCKQPCWVYASERNDKNIRSHHNDDDATFSLSTGATSTVSSSSSSSSFFDSTALNPQHRQLSNRWLPHSSQNLTWQLVLQGTVDPSYDVDVYDVDLFDTSQSTIRALQAKGIKVICYFSAGTYEYWRSDWSQYFSFVKPNVFYNGTQEPFAGVMVDWEGERWLDVRYLDLLKPILTSRIKLAVTKGCDAIDPDNLDSYQNAGEVRKPITAAKQLTYNRYIANTAHNNGISVGLKNDLGQVSGLVDYFDFAINEQCFYYKECSLYKPFIDRDKAVFGVEYDGQPETFCPKARSMGLSFQKKRLSLKNWRQGCEDYVLRGKTKI